MFENELLPHTMVQQGKHVDAVKCRTLFSGLISMLGFDIPQIPSGSFAPLAPSPSCGPERDSNIHFIGGWLQPQPFWLKNTSVRSCLTTLKSTTAAKQCH